MKRVKALKDNKGSIQIRDEFNRVVLVLSPEQEGLVSDSCTVDAQYEGDGLLVVDQEVVA